MAKKRDAIFNEAQISIIKAIVGDTVINVGTKMRYTSSPSLVDPNDIPNYAAVLNIVGGGLSFQQFSEADLVSDGAGGYNLPFTLGSGEVPLAILIEPSVGDSYMIGVNYDFSVSELLGFINNATQNIKVWYTGQNVVPPPTPPAPVFIVQPSASVSVLQGKSLTLTSNASDTFTYQWYKDGVAIVGENSSNITVNSFDPSKAGTYYVEAIGPGGTTQSTNSVVTNDAGVLISNFTSQDLNGGTHTAVALTATDGTDVINIPSGTQIRLRSGVSITISGYGTTPLTAQDGASVNTNMTISSQAFNPPISSPLSIYHRAVTGTCYTIGIPNTELENAGEDLYITIKRPGQPISSQPYYGYLSEIGDPSQYTIIVCSENPIAYKYGPSGPLFASVPGETITTGGACSIDSECSI